MTREPLPNRRDNRHVIIVWRGALVTVCVGVRDDGRAAEVFADGWKAGSDMQAVIEDGCVVASHLAQMGRTFAEQAGSVGRDEAGQPTSIMGRIIDAAAALEAEEAKPGTRP